MPDLTNLTNEECNLLFDMLKQEESRCRLPTGAYAIGTDRNERRRALTDLLWRLQIVCPSRSASEEELDREEVTERLGGYY